MSKINKSAMHQWQDGQIVTSAQLRQNEELLRTAINDTDTRVDNLTTNTYDKTTIDLKINNTTATLTVLAGADFPVGPYNTGQLFLKTSDRTLYGYSNGSWEKAVPALPVVVPAAFRTYMSSTLSVPSGSMTKVPYNNTVYDRTNNFNATTSAFTAMVSGYYRFTAAFGFNSIADGSSFTLELWLNGVSHTTLDRRHAGTANSLSVGGTTSLQLSAGDKVEIYVQQANVATSAYVSVNTNSRTYFCGEQV